MWSEKNRKINKRPPFIRHLRVPSAWTFIKNKASALAFSCEFFWYFQHATLLKTKTPKKLFSCEIYKIFVTTFFAEHPQRVPSNDMIIARYFVRFVVHWNRNKKISKILKMSLYLFKISGRSRGSDHITTTLRC